MGYRQAILLRAHRRVREWIYAPRRGTAFALLSSPLALLGRLYFAGTRVRRALYRKKILGSTRIQAPVIGIGNLTLGGSGKTTLSMELAEYLWRRGYRVAVLSRGYRAKRLSRVPLVISGGGGGAREDAGLAGDEACMMADHLGDGVIVMSGKDRVKAARRAVDELGAGVLILDDSFQYLRLAKDLEFLLLHEDDLRGHIQPLPLGPFREPLTSARWADLIVLVRGLHTDGRKIPEMPLPLLGKKIVEARPKSVRYRSVWPEMRDVEPEELRGKRILAFASIARASSFREILRTLDPAEEELIDFPDHHNYARAELIEMSRRAREKAAIVLTTEKDRVKVDWKLFRDTQCFTALPRYGVFEEDSDLRRAVDSLLSCGGSCAI